jgi:hypothetical protein
MQQASWSANMRKLLVQSGLAALIAIGSGTTASAAGWSGGDSSVLRASFNQGMTLTKVWSRINDR